MAMTPRDMELRLVNGMVLKVQLEEMAGGVGERVAALEAKLREQGDAMAAMQRDLAETRRAMVLLKGMAATGALGEGAGKGSEPEEAAEGIGARRNNAFAALEVEEVKAQLEVARGEARDAASEVRGEMGALKAELARMRAAAERQAAEVAYVKATAAHSEARINDVELALAAFKEGPAEKIRAEREAGSAGEHAEAERREGKRRKRNEACKQEEMEDAPAGAGLGPFAVGGAPGGNRVEANRKGKAKEGDNELQGLRARVEALEKTSEGGSKIWEELIGVWAKVLPGRSRMDLSGVNMKRLERLGLWDANVTVAGLKWLNGLKSLQVIATETEDVECLIRDNFHGMIVTPGPL
ncbi:unnamed protein product [Closterium sp. Naga37s-1]|nr:unnamed protein product [Closterium sp. Naga37s-1]